jgi:hypothetical protein
MPGGGGGTETGRLAGAEPGSGVRVRLGSPEAAAGATGGGVTGRGASGGGIIGSGATGGEVIGRGIAGALLAAAGSGRLRRPTRVPVSVGRIRVPVSAAAGRGIRVPVSTGRGSLVPVSAGRSRVAVSEARWLVPIVSAARREPAWRRPEPPFSDCGLTRATRVPTMASQAESHERTAPIACRTVSAAAEDNDLLMPPRRGDSLIATTRAVTAATTWSSVPAPARVSSVATSSAICSPSLPRPVRRPGSGSASSTARASGWAGSGYARRAAG